MADRVLKPILIVTEMLRHFQNLIAYFTSEGGRLPRNVCVGQNILASLPLLYGFPAPQQTLEAPVCRCS